MDIWYILNQQVPEKKEVYYGTRENKPKATGNIRIY